MANKTRRQKARDRADKQMSLLVRYRDDAQCFCGSRDNVQAGHLVGRANYGLRWDLMNVNAQCSTCNFSHNVPSRVHRYFYWHQQRYGQEAHKAMLLRAGKRERDWSTSEIEELADKFSMMYIQLQSMRVWNDARLIALGFYEDANLNRLGRKHLTYYELVQLGQKEKKK